MMEDQSMHKTRIIIADDHQLVIEGVKSLLASEDELVVKKEVNDGLSAIKAIDTEAGGFELLITDINMPEMSGIELCRKVKQAHPRIKVLVLSMYDNPSMIKESIAAEADGYILKNSGKAEFKDAIKRIMNDGTYYSQEIMPVILRIMKNEKQVAKYGTLTSRELEILQLIVKEMTSEEIGDKLFISKKTVDNHRTHLLEKTGCKSTIGLVKFAIHNGLA
jgi:DNA-binding NarL/FixJ family response regulator